MHILKNIWFNWQKVRREVIESNLYKKIKNGDLYYVLLTLYLFIQVFSESQLNELIYVKDILSILRLIVLVLIIIQAVLMFDFLNLLKSRKKEMTIQKLFFYSFIICSIINALLCGGGHGLLGLILVVIAAKGKSLKQIFKTVLISLSAAHIFVLLLCVTGILNDSVDIRWLGNQTGAFFKGEYVRHAFGFLNSNQIPLIFMLLLFMYVGIRAEKLTVIETVGTSVINYIIFSYCGSRISFILVFAFLICFWLAKICPQNVSEKIRWLKLGYIIYPATFLSSLIGSYAYSADSTFWNYADLVINNRLSLGHRLLMVYPFSLFGYGKYAGTYSGLGEATADNGYVLLFLQAGLLLSVMIIILHEYIMHICIKKKCTPLVLCLIFLAIENLINAHMPSYKLIPLYCILVNSQDTLLDCKGWKNRKQIELINKLKYISGKIGFKVREIWESKRGIK